MWWGILGWVALNAPSGPEPLPHFSKTYVFTKQGSFESLYLNWDSGYTLRTPILWPGFQWSQCVASWNFDEEPWARSNATIKLLLGTRESKEFSLGSWSLRDVGFRGSVKNQKDLDGNVLTDTFVTTRPGGEATVSVTTDISGPNRAIRPPSFRLFSINFLDTLHEVENLESDRSVWGKRPLDVPEKCQMDYENGDVLCSPTSLSMILSYWAAKLERPQLDRDVPDVSAAVFDKNWPGTGNWAFNVAYAGSLPGLRAYVDRMEGVGEIEQWIALGVPLACSVSYDLLKGKGKKGVDDGHLIVVTGFSSSGDVIVNDPGRSAVHQTYSRDHFRSAWKTSGRTAYVVIPRGWSKPHSDRVLWQ